MARILAALILSTFATSLSLSLFNTPQVATITNHCIDPNQCTCAEISLSSTNWTALDFHYYSTSGQKLEMTSIGFSVVNLAIRNVTRCAVRMVKGRRSLDDTEWYRCDPSTRSPVTFRFNTSSGLLELKQDWVCDKGAPSRVWVTGNATVPMHCKDTAGGLTRIASSWEPSRKRGFGMARDRGIMCDMANFTVPWLEIAASG